VTGVSAKTIRYYESIGLVPNPQRAENNYRQYAPEAVERLRFIVSARSLGFSLTDIGEFLSARDEGTLPCKRVLDSIDGRIAEIDRRIADLLALRDNLSRVRLTAKVYPDKKCDDDPLLYHYHRSTKGQVTPTREKRNVRPGMITEDGNAAHSWQMQLFL
jgi:DNA-binding transcriptional MerR regulator